MNSIIYFYLIIILAIFSKIAFAQDEKYHGGDYDGFGAYTLPTVSTLNGETISVAKYSGGFHDGYNVMIGILSQLDGASIEVAKYQGGEYDGFSNDESDILYLDGVIYLNSAKYAGGNYDGFSTVLSALTQLDGISISLVKYHGGGYDGYATTVSFSDISLPVTLTFFNLNEIPNQTAIKVEWQTESEIENAYWLLLRSTENDSVFATLQKIEGQGNSSVSSDYFYQDSDVEAGSNYTYQLADVSINGQITYHEEKSISVSIPKSFELFQNFPNPFNPNTNIKFALPEPSLVKIYVYNILVQKIVDLHNEQKKAGYHTVVWDGNNNHGNKISSGMYIYLMQAQGLSANQNVQFQKVKRMVLVK